MASIPGNVTERIYDPNCKYTPKNKFDYFEEGSTKLTPSQKATKVWGQQNAFIYTKRPEETDQEKLGREALLKKIQPGQDGRSRIHNTTDWPYVFLAQLTMKFGQHEYGGSGAMVGPQHLLTCGHNVYNPTKNEWAQEINVYPALNGKSAPFGEAKVTKVYTFTDWTQNGDPKYDIALLILSEPIGKYTGWGSMLCPDDATLSQNEVNIYGYPGDKGNKCFEELWGMKHKITHISPEDLEYGIDTFGGQSGSAIWMNQHGIPMIVGVHAYGPYGGRTLNSGVRISNDKFLQFHRIIKETYKLVPTAPIQFPSQRVPASTLVFGAADWNQFVGQVGSEPPLPPNIDQILLAPDPSDPTKKVLETHVLVLIPSMINDTPFTLTLFEEMNRTRKGGSKGSPYNQFAYFRYRDSRDRAKIVYSITHLKESYWVLFAMEVDKSTINQNFSVQDAILQRKGYAFAEFFEAAVTSSTYHMKFGKKLWESTGTRCREADGQIWLHGNDEYYYTCSDSILPWAKIPGVAGMRRFGKPTPFPPVHLPLYGDA